PQAPLKARSRRRARRPRASEWSRSVAPGGAIGCRLAGDVVGTEKLGRVLLGGDVAKALYGVAGFIDDGEQGGHECDEAPDAFLLGGAVAVVDDAHGILPQHRGALEQFVSVVTTGKVRGC